MKLNKLQFLCKKIQVPLIMVLSVLAINTQAEVRPNDHGIAAGEYKFLGNISSESNKCSCDYTSFLDADFDFGNKLNTEWNQITPENSGKWGSVESTKGTYNWSQMTRIWNNAMYFISALKFHTLVWGSQMPSWFYNSNLTQAQKVTAVENWIKANCNFIAGTETTLSGHRIMIDVVNEPINTPNTYQYDYSDALNNAWKDFISYKFPLKNYPNGTNTEYDWIVWSFEKAREYCPNAALLLNEFHVINNANAVRSENSSKKVLDEYKKIVKLLKDKDLIDGVAMQTHHFSIDTAIDTDTGLNSLVSNLNSLAAEGVPVYISELDITGCDSNKANCSEDKQKTRYERLFPKLWENTSVVGVTIWGAIEGETWIKDNNGNTLSHLIKKNGTDTKAMQWLKSYFQNRRDNGLVSESNVSYLKTIPIQRDIEIRAKGTAGSEKIRLIVNDKIVDTWTLTTSMKKYYSSTPLAGKIKVEFFNDANGRDVQLDYLSVNGITRQAESQPVNTAAYQNGKCGGSGGGKTEWMKCNGYIDFRNL